MRRQRSRVHWLKEGNSNTASFHRIRERSTISHPVYESRILEVQGDIDRVFVELHSQIIGQTVQNRILLKWEKLYPGKFSNPKELESPFTEAEV